MMKKKVVWIFMAAVMMVTMAACGSKDQGTVNGGSANEGTADEEDSEDAGTLEDKGATGEEGTADEGAAGGEGTEEGETFTVGFDQDFPPMGFVGDDGQFTGFDLELAAEVADRMGYELKLQPIAWDSKDLELETKSIDCVWNGFTINGREDKYTWTEPYMANEQVFVVTKDSGITDFSGLQDKVVTVQNDSSAEKALEDRTDLTDTFKSYERSADYNTALMDLETGAVDAVAMDSVVANYQIEKRGDNFVVLEETLSAEEYGVGFLLGNEALRDKVQNTLKDMAADGTLAEISMKWFGKDVTTIK